MSGGHFDYKQYSIDHIAETVKKVIEANNSTEKDEWGYPIGRNYSNNVINELKKGLEILESAAIYANRIDWLLSGDDGEESFLKRLKEDLKEI